MTTLGFNTELSGEYRMVITRADGTIEDSGWFHNLILDAGLDRLGSGFQSATLAYARVGTGSSTPIASQVQLDSQIAVSGSGGSATSTSNEGAPTYRSTLTYTFAFAQGAVVGNVTEVGIGWGTTGATLFSRALILDNTGSPTTITLVSIDQLTVFYRIRISPPLTDGTGVLTLGSTNYSYTTRILNAATFGQTQYLFHYGFEYFGQPYSTATTTFGAGASLAAITASNPVGTQSGSVPTANAVPNTYTNGTFYRDSVVTWPISSGNATGGIQAIMMPFGTPYQPFRYQIVFGTPIPKSSTNVLTLTIRFSWARA